MLLSNEYILIPHVKLSLKYDDEVATSATIKVDDVIKCKYRVQDKLSIITGKICKIGYKLNSSLDAVERSIYFQIDGSKEYAGQVVYVNIEDIVALQILKSTSVITNPISTVDNEDQAISLIRENENGIVEYSKDGTSWKSIVPAAKKLEDGAIDHVSDNTTTRDDKINSLIKTNETITSLQKSVDTLDKLIKSSDYTANTNVPIFNDILTLKAEVSKVKHAIDNIKISKNNQSSSEDSSIDHTGNDDTGSLDTVVLVIPENLISILSNTKTELAKLKESVTNLQSKLPVDGSNSEMNTFEKFVDISATNDNGGYLSKNENTLSITLPEFKKLINMTIYFNFKLVAAGTANRSFEVAVDNGDSNNHTLFNKQYFKFNDGSNGDELYGSYICQLLITDKNINTIRLTFNNLNDDKLYITDQKDDNSKGVRATAIII